MVSFDFEKAIPLKETWWADHRENGRKNSKPKRTAVISTDGACKDNGTVNAVAAIGVFCKEDRRLDVSQRLKYRQTSQRAEMAAINCACQQAKKYGYDAVKIYTDSGFTLQCLNYYVGKWLRNGWQTCAGTTAKNKDDLIMIHKAMQGLFVELQWVPKAHNKQSDRLARAGRDLNYDDGFNKYTAVKS